jgi:predicted negative regulator of RcsB-dependent stress response
MKIIITIAVILISIFVLTWQIFEMIAKENQENEKIFKNFSEILDNDKSDMI